MTAVSTGVIVAAVTFVLTYTFYMLGLWRGRREQADLRLGLYRTALDEVAKANHRANKYRLAWVSARGRARRPPTKRLVLHPEDVTIAFDMSGRHDLQHVQAYIYDPPRSRKPDGHVRRGLA